MNRKDLCDRMIAAGVTRRSDPFYQKVYDYKLQPQNTHVIRALQQYDRHLFARFNVAMERWEIARWRSHTVPSSIPTSDEEKCLRSFTVFTVENFDGTYRPIDWRSYHHIVHGDPWRRFGSVESMARQMDEQDRKRYARDQKDFDQYADDWASDNKNQIRSFIGRQGFISTARPGVV